MFTQCPACKTVFRLHPDQINAARGQVRCSRCHAVFNAVDNLFQQAGDKPSEEIKPEEIKPDASTSTIGKAHPQTKPGQEPDFTKASHTADEETLRGISDEAAIESITTPFSALDVDPVSMREELSDEEGGDDFEPVQSKDADHGDLFEALRQDQQGDAGVDSFMKEDVFAEKDLRTFRGDEEDEQHRLPYATSPLDEPSSTGHLPLPEVEVGAAADLTVGDEFDEDLLSIFGDETPKSKTDFDKSPESPVAQPPSAEESLLTEKAIEISAAVIEQETDALPIEESAVRRKKPPEGDSWDLFSEENIEALLSATKDIPPLDDGALFVEERNRDSLISEDGLDLTTRGHASPVLGDDETLQHPQQPEQNEADELDAMTSDSREAGEIPGTESDSRPQTVEIASYNLPLEQSPVRGSLFGTMLWGSGIVLMLAGLALQYLYYHRMTLVVNPQLRPVLAQMCQITGCQLPPRRDPASIELGHHLVQFHPRYVDSLLITATLVNHADFTQPFPIVEVVMTDLDQKVIARRRFLPDDYLAGGNATGGLPPETEVPLILEVLDPGKKAVGFEFKFF